MSVASVGRPAAHRQTSGACKPERARARRGAGADTEQAPHLSCQSFAATCSPQPRRGRGRDSIRASEDRLRNFEA